MAERLLLGFTHILGLRVIVKTPPPGKAAGAEILITPETLAEYARRYRANLFDVHMIDVVLKRATLQIALLEHLYLVGNVTPTGDLAVETQQRPALESTAIVSFLHLEE